MRDNFLNNLADGVRFEQLFDTLPGVCFFAKNRDGRIIMGNKLFVAHCGKTSLDELIGLHDHEIFPANLAECYIRDDRAVLETGDPIRNRVELFPNSQGAPEWFITNKIPVRDKSGEICGVSGTTQSYEQSKTALQPYLDIAAAVDHIKAHYSEPLTVEELARKVHLSVRQFERKFKATFHTTPRQYLIKMRILAACDQLLHSRKSITEIALDTGFYDHSAFTHQFTRHMQQTPREYRKQYLQL
jgi:AraC-like DNA-binding protein